MSIYDDRDTAITRDPLQGQGQQHYQQPMQPQYQQPYAGYGYGSPYGRGYGGGYGMGMRRQGGWSETKPFFMTSEFLATLLGVIAIAITASVAEDLDSRLATALIAGLIAFYTLSRGIAKSGTRSRASDPRDELDFHRSNDHSHES
jgi:hypothetical protein